MSLDLSELEMYGRQTQEQLAAAYREALQALGDAAPETNEEQPPPKPAQPEGLSKEEDQRIEELFEQASKDRAKAFALKHELDRLGAFRRYEDRFLELFKGQ